MALGGRGGGSASLPAQPQSQGLVLPLPAPDFWISPGSSFVPRPGRQGTSRSSRTETLGGDPPCQATARATAALPASLSPSQPSRGPGGKDAPQVCPCLDQSLFRHMAGPPQPCVPTAVSYCWRVPALGAPRPGSALWAGSALPPAPACLGSHPPTAAPSLVPTPLSRGVQREGRGVRTFSWEVRWDPKLLGGAGALLHRGCVTKRCFHE